MTFFPAGPDYAKAMLHVELALRRASQSLRQGGETSIEDALWLIADHLGELADEARKASAHTPAEGKTP